MPASSPFPAATRIVRRYASRSCEVKITRPQDNDDSTVDPVSLQLTKAASTTLYEGPALVSAMGDVGEQRRGEAVLDVIYYTVAMDIMDVEFMSDDEIEVVTAVHDPQLEGKVLICEGEIPTGLNVYKRLRAKLEKDSS